MSNERGTCVARVFRQEHDCCLRQLPAISDLGFFMLLVGNGSYLRFISVSRCKVFCAATAQTGVFDQEDGLATSLVSTRLARSLLATEFKAGCIEKGKFLFRWSCHLLVIQDVGPSGRDSLEA